MRLVNLLQQAYAIEIGAFEAYEGHIRSLSSAAEQEEIREIQLEELMHKEEVGKMLSELGAEPSSSLNAALWLIGKTISAGCHVMGYKAGMWGAGVMENLGGLCYKTIAAEAASEGYHDMAVRLSVM